MSTHHGCLTCNQAHLISNKIFMFWGTQIATNFFSYAASDHPSITDFNVLNKITTQIDRLTVQPNQKKQVTFQTTAEIFFPLPRPLMTEYSSFTRPILQRPYSGLQQRLHPHHPAWQLRILQHSWKHSLDPLT